MSDGQLHEGRLYRLLEVGRNLVGTLDIDEVLDRVLETARDLTGARYAALGILDDRRRELDRFLTRGIDERTHREIGELPRGRGILGILIDDPRPLRLADIGRHPRSFGFPSAHPPMRTFLGVPLVIRGEVWGNIYLTEKDGGEEFDASDERALVILAEWASLAIDNARLYQAAEDRRVSLERSVQELEATTAIAEAVAGETALERVLELVAKRGRALIGAEAVMIELVEGPELLVAAVAGNIPSALEGTRLPVKRSLADEVIRSRRPKRLSQLSARSLRPTLGEHGVEPSGGLMVPLTFRGQVVGVLAAFDKAIDGPDFDPRDERLLLGFAASAAAAVVTAKSVARDVFEQSVATAEEERRRWARELHDETLQDLAGLRLTLSSGRRTRDPDALQGLIEKARDQAGGTMDKLRRLVAELRPAALDELGLKAAVESLAEGMGDLEVSCRVELGRDSGRAATRLVPEIELAAYRVMQEALTNVAKHSGARSVEVELVEGPEVVEIRVEDDGRGFELRSDTAGFGLVGMRERVAGVSGTLRIESRPGAGTRVTARLPALHGREAAPAARAS